MAVQTVKQGLALDVMYRAALVDEADSVALINALNRVDGVQSVILQRAADDAPALAR